MSTDDASWQRLIGGLRDGDPVVLREFCERYAGPLEQLADKHLAAKLRRRVGPEDVVQSACRTFLRRVGGGEFELADSESLWRLLCAITLTKIREQARFHQREKRGLDRESGVPLATGADSASGFVPVAREPSPAEAAEFADQFQRLLASLSDEEQRVVDLKLQEYTNEEVAEQMGCSERSVRRILKKIKSRLSDVFTST